MERKPLLIYDGDCGFCRRWVLRWQRLTGSRVVYAPYQKVATDFPKISPEEFRMFVQLVEGDGAVFRGAEAVFRVLAYAPGRSWMLWMYRKIPGFRFMSEWVYGGVAGHRIFFSAITRWLFGNSPEPPDYRLARWVFLRLVALCYLIAFVSLWIQVDGLLGSRGILPAQEYLRMISEHVGRERYWFFPTLFWLRPGDALLHVLCGGGALFSLGVLAGILQGPLFLFMWAFYLSLATVGQDFLSFQWDNLLLEVGFLAVFFAPWNLRDRLRSSPNPSRTILWLLRWVLFRLMFESGCVKLLSGDTTWRHLTALRYHYETQPLPTWIGWYAHQFPAWFQTMSAGSMFAIELGAPFLIFAPRRLRFAGCAALVFLQVLIGITGNYCFFNLLTVTLCLLLLDDACLRRLFPKSALKPPAPPRRSRWRIAGCAALTGMVLFVSGTELVGMFGGRTHLPRPVLETLRWAFPLRTVNNYGLFAVMTTQRIEILLEGSRDGKKWLPYEFKWKPGDVRRRPGFVEPHQPRLDWQMWFAALGSYRDNPWVLSLMARILQGSPAVLALLDKNPFPDKPPKFLRAEAYQYHFTDFSARRLDGSWWRREYKGLYCPIVSLRPR